MSLSYNHICVYLLEPSHKSIYRQDDSTHDAAEKAPNTLVIGLSTRQGFPGPAGGGCLPPPHEELQMQMLDAKARTVQYRYESMLEVRGTVPSTHRQRHLAPRSSSSILAPHPRMEDGLLGIPAAAHSWRLGAGREPRDQGSIGLRQGIREG